MIFAGTISGAIGAIGSTGFGCSAAGSGSTTCGSDAVADSLGAADGRTILATGALATTTGDAARTFAIAAAGAGAGTTTGNGAFGGAVVFLGGVAAATGSSAG